MGLGMNWHEAKSTRKRWVWFPKSDKTNIPAFVVETVINQS